jgi:hypothetical protein
MPFYVRKSLRVGALRFNLSKSGVGVSAGFTGFRVGRNARGNYVHMGRHGVYYRAALPSGAPARPSPQPSPSPRDDIEMREIDSGSVLAMTDASSETLLADIRERWARLRSWPWCLVGGLLLSAAAGEHYPSTGAAVLLAALPMTWLLARWDAARRTAVIFYDFEDETVSKPFEALQEAFNLLARNGGVWHVGAEGRVRDSKYHAGANTLVRRQSIRPAERAPRGVAVNVPVFEVPVGTQRLHFLPDRVLVAHGGNIGAVAYSALKVEVNETNFIEDGTVPADAKVVGRTWKYVNKKGGPDRRFKDNRELPIARYEEIRFGSGTGLSETIQCSRLGTGAAVRQAVEDMAATEPSRPAQSGESAPV